MAGPNPAQTPGLNRRDFEEDPPEQADLEVCAGSDCFEAGQSENLNPLDSDPEEYLNS